MTYLYCNAKKPEYRQAQRERLQAEHPDGRAIMDTGTGENWAKIREAAAPGDLIITESARNVPAEDLAADYRAIFEAGADLAFKKEPALDSILYRQALEGSGPQIRAAIMGLLQAQIRATAAAAEAEAAAHREKTRAALETAAAAGRKPGRKTGERQQTRKESYMKEQIRQYQAQGLKPGQILEAINSDSNSEMRISHNTLYKYIREMQTPEQ